MSFVVQGPYPEMVNTLLLPSPLQGNNKGNQATVVVVRTMDGTPYTYIKPKRGRQGYSWDFRTSKDKGLEAKEFIRLHADGLVRLVDDHDVEHIGYLTINPWETRGDGRAEPWGLIEEAVTFTLEFEERV